MLEYLFRAIDEPGAYRLPFFNLKKNIIVRRKCEKINITLVDKIFPKQD